MTMFHLNIIVLLSPAQSSLSETNKAGRISLICMQYDSFGSTYPHLRRLN